MRPRLLHSSLPLRLVSDLHLFIQTYNQTPQYQQYPPTNNAYGYDPSYPAPAPPPPAPKPKKDGPSEVSRHVIFLGLDPDMREADVSLRSLTVLVFLSLRLCTPLSRFEC